MINSMFYVHINIYKIDSNFMIAVTNRGVADARFDNALFFCLVKGSNIENTKALRVYKH